MDAEDSCRNLSETDILFELFMNRCSVFNLNDWELEAGYGACQKYIEIAKAPTSLLFRLHFDCATRLGYKEEALQIALRASTCYEATMEMISFLENTSLLQEENSQNTSTKPKKEEKKKKKKKKKKKLTHQQVDASSIAASTDRSDDCMSIGGSESLPSKNRQKVAAPDQIGIGYVLLPMGVAEDMEVEKGERSVFLCVSNSTQGRYGCDWYSLDLLKKEFRKIFGRLEWGGINTTRFGVAAVGSIIYIIGGQYPDWRVGRTRSDESCSNDVFYLDVHNPRDGWKAGPQLPSPHFDPIATTSMNGTVYVFNSKYVFARALDTSYSESGWKSLESPNLESPSDLHFVKAFPDPIRDRIFLSEFNGDVFAYYPRKGKLELIDSELETYADRNRMTEASAVVDGVLYYNEPYASVLLCAYDLGKRKILTPHYLYKVDIAPYAYFMKNWNQLLDLGGGKLCLAKYGVGREELGVFLKLRVRKEAGEDKVQITVVSFDILKIVEGCRMVHSVAL